jgi:hypothetical protein
MKRKHLARLEEFTIFNDLITPQEAAREFHYSPRTIVGYCDSGYVAARQYGRQWVLRRSSLISFLQQRANRLRSRYAG